MSIERGELPCSHFKNDKENTTMGNTMILVMMITECKINLIKMLRDMYGVELLVAKYMLEEGVFMAPSEVGHFMTRIVEGFRNAGERNSTAWGTSSKDWKVTFTASSYEAPRPIAAPVRLPS